MQPKMSFATVVFGGEVPLLELQARSLAKFLDPSQVDQILVLVNDASDVKVSRKLRDILTAYGPLADKVVIKTGDDLFAKPAVRHITAWSLDVLKLYLPSFLQSWRKAGWRGLSGWRMQQAFKLAAGGLTDSPYLVILDAKNVFLRPIGPQDFVHDDGRPLARFEQLGGISTPWMSASLKAVGSELSVADITNVTQFITPFSVRTSLLRETVQTMERTGGPVQLQFLPKKDHPTEFMALNACCYEARGTIEEDFAPGLVDQVSLFLSMSDDQIDERLADAKQRDAFCLSLHSAVIGRFSPEQMQGFAETLVLKGIVGNEGEAKAALGRVAQLNKKRTAWSRRRAEANKAALSRNATSDSSIKLGGAE